MTIENAIETAIKMESAIRDLYAEAYALCSDQAGRRIFAMLRDDEQYHLDYLTQRLEQYRQTGQLHVAELKTIIPSPSEIQEHLATLKKTLAGDDRGMLQQMLTKALQVEIQTSEFYKKMTSDGEGEAREMFARFLQIEDAHIAAVQAELDYVMKTGYWFDFKEFDME